MPLLEQNHISVHIAIIPLLHILQTRIDQYFSHIAEIIKKGKIPARIKFMLQDVQELRDNNWVPKKGQEQSLKTIDQVKEEERGGWERERESDIPAEWLYMYILVVQNIFFVDGIVIMIFECTQTLTV